MLHSCCGALEQGTGLTSSHSPRKGIFYNNRNVHTFTNYFVLHKCKNSCILIYRYMYYISRSYSFFRMNKQSLIHNCNLKKNDISWQSILSKSVIYLIFLVCLTSSREQYSVGLTVQVLLKLTLVNTIITAFGKKTLTSRKQRIYSLFSITTSSLYAHHENK